MAKFNQITRKEFTDILTTNTSVFIASVFPKQEVDNDLKVKLDNLKYFSGERRTCIAKPTYLEFSNGSRLYFTQQGKREFYQYDKFIIYKLIARYEMSGELETSYNYIIYRLID